MNAREVMSLVDLAAPPTWGRTRRLAACRQIEDLRGAFRRSVPRAVADFVDGGAEDEVTLRRNREAFERVRLVPRLFAGAPDVDLSTELLGDRVTMPVALAPTGIARLVHPEGELAVARGAAPARGNQTRPSLGAVGRPRRSHLHRSLHGLGDPGGRRRRGPAGQPAVVPALRLA
jgi:L-lactate dehydrogenase (cytochrome)